MVRANVPVKTWSADGARVEAPGGTSSATDCDNGEQVVVATDDGGATVDAPVHSEVRSEELKILGHAGANGAAVAGNGGDSPLVTMEPKAEESVPAVDDPIRDPMEGSLAPWNSYVSKGTDKGDVRTKLLTHLRNSRRGPRQSVRRTARSCSITGRRSRVESQRTNFWKTGAGSLGRRVTETRTGPTAGPDANGAGGAEAGRRAARRRRLVW